MDTELIHVGFGNVMAINRVMAVVSPSAAPSKRMIQEAKTQGLLIDMTNGRRTKSVLFMDSGHVALTAITPETIWRRVNGTRLAVARGEQIEIA